MAVLVYVMDADTDGGGINDLNRLDKVKLLLDAQTRTRAGRHLIVAVPQQQQGGIFGGRQRRRMEPAIAGCRGGGLCREGLHAGEHAVLGPAEAAVDTVCIFEVLEKVHLDIGTSSKSMPILKSFINGIFEKLSPSVKQRRVFP
ncbi:hypothetical protein ACQ4PT_026993 [Festuca glaucescens]